MAPASLILLRPKEIFLLLVKDLWDLIGTVYLCIHLCSRTLMAL